MTQPKRRPRGTGTIEALTDGRFRARFAFGHPGVGESRAPREDIKGSPFPTYAAAEAALDGLLLTLREADGTTMRGKRLNAYGRHVLNLRQQEGYKSVQSERDRWECYVEDSDFGRTPLGYHSAAAFRAFLASLKKQDGATPPSHSTKAAIKTLLTAVFDRAVEEDLIAENPIAGLKLKKPGRTREAMRPLTLAQAERLLEVVGDEEPAVAIALGTGARTGEVEALEWSDEDIVLDTSDPHVWLRYSGPGKVVDGVRVKPPRKNGEPLRVSLFGWALETFRKLPRGAEGTPVFPGIRSEYRAKGQLFNREAWKRWLKEAGIDRNVRPHDLRHTMATLLLNGSLGRKWSYEEVKGFLGHSSVKVTERYAKVLDSLTDQAAAEMRGQRGASRPKIGPEVDALEVAQALEIIGRRGSDSNRRMTVLQTEANLDSSALLPLLGLTWAYLESVVKREPTAHAAALRLAAAVMDLLSEAETKNPATSVKRGGVLR